MLPVFRLGNDIVDLSSPDVQKKYLDHHFLQRVFTTQEVSAIKCSANKTLVFWAIWAAKEAAYKACQKSFPALIFAHQKFFLNDSTLILLSQNKKLKELAGTLIYQSHSISIKWQNYLDAIHCLAVMSNSPSTFKNWRDVHFSVLKKPSVLDNVSADSLKKYFSQQELTSIFSKESLLTRLHAKKFLQTLGFDPDIKIIRHMQLNRLGPPQLVIDNQQEVSSEHEISLSHDGGWTAVAVRKGRVE